MTYNKHAGRSTREMASRRRRTAIWIGLFGIGLLVVITLFIQNAKAWGIGGAGILILLIFMRLISDLTKNQVDRKLKLEKRAIRGAKAEEKIGEMLVGLSSEYFVLHDVESPYGNIDHIVFGKNTGVFLIETKAHGGKVESIGDAILVNGKPPEKDFIAQTLRNSYWLRDQISEITGSKPWITPILVFSNAFVKPMRPIKGVNIINKKYFLSLLFSSNKPNTAFTQVWENKENIASSLM